MIKVCIYWRTKNAIAKERIRKRFNITQGETINGETWCEIKEEDYDLLKLTAEGGFIDLRNKEKE